MTSHIVSNDSASQYAMPVVEEMLLHVVKVWTMVAGRCLTNATGFFYQQDGYLYLVTAQHVVHNPSAGHHPDSLHVSLHVDDRNLQNINELSIPLYVGGVRQWYQCTACEDADIVAVAINEPYVLSRHVVRPFLRQDILCQSTPLALGQDALILGFPLGFHDTVHHLPIVRRASIASSFPHPFKGQPYFLTDGRLHRGMSGSPIIARIRDDLKPENSDRSVWRLLGIHTSSLDVSDRDPSQDERLALNKSWYATLIPEMLPKPMNSKSLFDSKKIRES